MYYKCMREYSNHNLNVRIQYRSSFRTGRDKGDLDLCILSLLTPD